MLALSQPDDPNSSLHLFRRAQRGDELALNDLLTRYLPRLRAWARGRLPSPLRSIRSTEDVVQDAVLKALPHLAHVELRTDGAVLAYLRQAVRNHIVDLFRRSVRRPTRASLPADLHTPEADPLLQAIGAEAEEHYEQALRELDEGDQQAVLLRVEFGMTYEEIAAALGKPSTAAARMAVSRALGRLASAMARRRA